MSGVPREDTHSRFIQQGPVIRQDILVRRELICALRHDADVAAYDC